MKVSLLDLLSLQILCSDKEFANQLTYRKYRPIPDKEGLVYLTSINPIGPFMGQLAEVLTT
jgi:hypothetical protein